MTAHIDTGAHLPREFFDKMLAAKTFQSGMMAVRQIEFSLFDMSIHADFDPKSSTTVQCAPALFVMKLPYWDHPNGTAFQIVFPISLAAVMLRGYYSYKWAGSPFC